MFLLAPTLSALFINLLGTEIVIQTFLNSSWVSVLSPIWVLLFNFNRLHSVFNKVQVQNKLLFNLETKWLLKTLHTLIKPDYRELNCLLQIWILKLQVVVVEHLKRLLLTQIFIVYLLILLFLWAHLAMRILYKISYELVGVLLAKTSKQLVFLTHQLFYLWRCCRLLLTMTVN